jgi:formylglycine-generating enzyme required for sulfatase activity
LEASIRFVVIGVIVCSAFSAACSDNKCAVGSTAGCPCADGKAGTQWCQPNGTFSQCSCPSPLAPPAPKKEDLRVEPKAGYVFLRIPAGTFNAGCVAGDAQCESDEKPAKRAAVEEFFIGKNAVTSGQYSKCVAAGACNAASMTVEWADLSEADRAKWSAFCTGGRAEKQDYPINCVDWKQATAFCQWIGGRLPSSLEWEYAAKSGEDRIYPWGNDAPTPEKASFGQKEPYHGPDRVGSHPAGASKWGLLDMAGNVRQWTATDYDSTHKEERGGSWMSFPQHLRSSHRYRLDPTFRPDTFGFRCAQ